MIGKLDMADSGDKDDFPAVCRRLSAAFRHDLIQRAEEKFFRAQLLSVSTLSPADVVLFVTVASQLRRLLLSGERDSAEGTDTCRETTVQNRCSGRTWCELLQGKIIATVFFEPSTRTRCSFEAATLRLGGQVISCGDMQTNSSTKKGESLEDSIRMFAAYSDCIVLRHPEKGSVERAAQALKSVRRGRPPCALLSAGDGAGEHPTQALLDLLTLVQLRPLWWDAQLKKIEGDSSCVRGPGDRKAMEAGHQPETSLRVAFVGDLKNGRTVHSLALLLSRFDCHLTTVSTESSALPPSVVACVRENFKAQGLSEERLICSSDFHAAIQTSDVLYMTRLQSERLAEPVVTTPGHQFPPSDFQLTGELLEKHARPHLKVMHPLPRREEIAVDVDDTDHCAYFAQAENGLYMRMALLAIFLNQRTARLLLGEAS
uniref:Aspartate carbamoyltransferase, putative n=1 Tax=Neospora caninum (strain Liverpool) TaxID=572307 RepID=A0A0F7UHN5_NEOCL|nr:TPA: aspartate carbamoyltransferase, putative [Neospora caninum Liverpool]